MRYILIILLLFSSVCLAGEAYDNSPHAQQLLTYYDAKVYKRGMEYLWGLTNPQNGSVYYYYPNSYYSFTTEADALANPILVRFSESGEAIFWFYSKTFYNAYDGVLASKLFSNQYIYQGRSYNRIPEPTSNSSMLNYGHTFWHPDEWVNPEYPNPPTAPPGGNCGEAIDYTDYFIVLKNNLVTASILSSLILGLFFWRLVILSRGQREL